MGSWKLEVITSLSLVDPLNGNKPTRASSLLRLIKPNLMFYSISINLKFVTSRGASLINTFNDTTFINWVKLQNRTQIITNCNF